MPLRRRTLWRLPPPMRPFRSTLLLRAVALAVMAGVGVSMVPAASAESGRLATLRGVLDDTQAFDAALQAARAAESAPLAAFAHAYAAEADDGTTAAAIAQLLGAESFSGVLPPAPDRAAPTPTAATGASASLAILGPASAVHADALDASATDVPRHARAATPLASAQPRGP